MSALPTSLLWRRLDTTGTELALLDDSKGLYARGTMIAAAPVPYTCTYELQTDPQWALVRLSVAAEGAGWRRTAKVERAAGRVRVTAGEQGDLDAALRAGGKARGPMPGADDPDLLAAARDVDLGSCPLMNTLPIRRLGLRAAAPGTRSEITVALVLVPSLAVVPAQQTYTAMGHGRVRFSSGTFTADLDLDPAGYVTRYPGLAERA